MTNKPERSVEEVVEYVETLLNKEGQLLTEDAEDWLTQTLQAERQRCEEVVEALMPWVEHDNQCILQRNERGEPTEDGGYRTMYAGVWYNRGEEPDCDCGLEKALTPPEAITNKTE